MTSPNGLSPVSGPTLSKAHLTRMPYPPAAQMLLPTTMREPTAIEACGGLYRPGAIAATAHPYATPYALQGNDRVFAHFSPELAAYYSRLSSLYGPNLKGCAEGWNAALTHPAVNACYPCDAYQYYGDQYGAFDVNGARRKNATRETTSTLKAWLYEHRKNPYPTKGEKIMLAIITKMTLTQVSTWFANARRRLKKENKMTWSPRNRSEDGDENGDKSEGEATQLTKEDVERLDLDVDNPEDKDGMVDDDDDVLDVECDDQRAKVEAELRERIGLMDHVDDDEGPSTNTVKSLDNSEKRDSPSCSPRSSPISSARAGQEDEPGSPRSPLKQEHIARERIRHSPHLLAEASDTPGPRKPKIWSLAETATSKDNYSHRRPLGHSVSRFHPYFSMHRPNSGPYSPPSGLGARHAAEEHLRASVGQVAWERMSGEMGPLAYRWNGLTAGLVVPAHPHPSTQESRTAPTTVVHSSSTPLVSPAPLRGSYSIHGKEVHVR